MTLNRRIIYDEPGQTCNRFWSYLDSVSWAVINKKRVYILFWDPSIKDYDRLRHSKYVSFPFYNKILMRLLGENTYLRKLRFLFSSKKALKFYCSSLGHKIGFIKGWDIRESDKYFPLVKHSVADIFQPNYDIYSRVLQTFESIRKQSNIIIGVHIRRGDYRDWRNGEYFFDHDVYVSYMDQIKSLFPDDNLAYYISSNERIPDEIYTKRFNVYYGIGGAADDLFALQQCDYIIGPPSTFSKWASAMSGTPLYIIYNKSNKIESIDSFSPLISHTKFENGRIIW